MLLRESKFKLLVILTGFIVGIASIVLTALGNPPDMGLSIACFIRDIAGALGLHTANLFQYVRPELIGITLGAVLMAAFSKEFHPRGGSSPVTRFIIAIVVMVGAMVFLGCPLRMLLRIGSGDLSAVIGFVGYIAGVVFGSLWLKGGFTLRRAYAQSLTEGVAMPAAMVLLLLLSVNVSSLFLFSTSGSGAMHAPIILSLIIGLLIGGICQYTRFCTMASIRNVIFLRDFTMLWGVLALIVTVSIGNAILGKLHYSFSGPLGDQSNWFWGFLSMALVGWGSVQLDGCPLRQLILAGEGDSDAAVVIIGFLIGAALCHNFHLVTLVSGPTLNGMIAVVAGFALLLVIGLTNREAV